ncbi:PDDEXK nuclease domain-containing protein [Moraxella osloensis]|uniref:DUF1016 domain-containing protein n=1 Tax=Faucicola osloensis TaxID=34062 RepID=A0A2D2LYG4_FAUOS|nr:PDDEXK nuclease domain-containing protein [Moraxella osloensis]ATR80057.1 DUF1016 domain-containing protein [Moraxella osloensis]
MSLTEHTNEQGYQDWLNQLKTQIRSSQQRAILAVNRELVLLYWQIGQDILQRQTQQGWGAKVIDRLSKDLSAEFPEIKGFSTRNLKYMRKFAEAWQDKQIVQQAVALLPWGHNLVLLDKFSDNETRLWYAQKAIEHGWSRNVLVHQIENGLLERTGQAVNNFSQILPEIQSDLATQTFKDPYIFDFLSLGEAYHERELETALTEHIMAFLLELGTGFAFVGKQRHIEVGGDDFYIDLLFYHLQLRCYVVIELKTGDFKPEHIGQLNFYVTAVDRQLKTEHDTPTIGLLLCKSRNEVVVEYALNQNPQPIGVAVYQLEKMLNELELDK